MDLGIAGKRAIVCGASAGLGRACAEALAREGVCVVIAARGEDRLRATAEAIRSETGGEVTAVAADVVTEEGRAAVLAACPEPDILINNAGGPPPGNFRDWSREDWIKALDANMLSAVFLTKAVIDPMIARRFGRIVNITSGAVKSPIGMLGLSNGARAGLTGFMSGLAREVAPHGVTINNLLPGPFDTDRLKGLQARTSQQSGRDIDAVRASAAKSVPAGRFGEPGEFGATAAFLCSAHAGFITAQNILMDGGAFPGLL